MSFWLKCIPLTANDGRRVPFQDKSLMQHSPLILRSEPDQATHVISAPINFPTSNQKWLYDS